MPSFTKWPRRLLGRCAYSPIPHMPQQQRMKCHIRPAGSAAGTKLSSIDAHSISEWPRPRRLLFCADIDIAGEAMAHASCWLLLFEKNASHGAYRFILAHAALRATFYRRYAYTCAAGACHAIYFCSTQDACRISDSGIRFQDDAIDDALIQEAADTHIFGHYRGLLASLL